ncbi:hypothetical protein LWI29_007369 [Acer saccharum]|uniref:DNA mismatch repair proteins mutS family domain-containing protein n=1 Tax=Acer saccharum TaxID=4024 RepID=A0AA39S7S2_ACESA|nr:hypothetical protein LWI29_007369 [Acer saccharum]
MEEDGGERSSFVTGLIENRAKEVGVAAFDLRSATLHLSQYIETSSSYQNTKTLLHFYDPMVIIVSPNKFAPDGMVGVSELVDRFYASVKKAEMARACFDDTKGAVLIKNLAAKEPSALGLDTYYKQYYLCLAAAAATIKWTRLLRANLLQPLKDIETINTRLDCLDELMSNEQLFFGLSQVLRKFPKETDRVLCHFCFKPKKVTSKVLDTDNAKKSQTLISSIILLKTALDALPLLTKVLKDSQCFLLANIHKSICENEKYASIRNKIGEVIDEDVLHARVPFVARTQQCFAVKAGIDGLLDIARRSFCDTSEAIHSLATKYREDFKMPNLKLPFNNRQGFYFSIPQKDVQGKLPNKFIQFMTEMKETAFIMQNISQRSLIVMDELGRATSSSDGFAIAWSCCEHLLSLKAYTIFATHMENLTELATIYPNVKILHFYVDLRNNRLDFKFQLMEGPRHVPHYGLLLAQVAGLPSSVIETARNITTRITEKEVQRMEVNCLQHNQIQMTYRIAQRLLCLKYSNQDEESIRQALQNLKESYINGRL